MIRCALQLTALIAFISGPALAKVTDIHRLSPVERQSHMSSFQTHLDRIRSQDTLIESKIPDAQRPQFREAVNALQALRTDLASNSAAVRLAAEQKAGAQLNIIRNLTSPFRANTPEFQSLDRLFDDGAKAGFHTSPETTLEKKVSEFVDGLRGDKRSKLRVIPESVLNPDMSKQWALLKNVGSAGVKLETFDYFQNVALPLIAKSIQTGRAGTPAQKAQAEQLAKLLNGIMTGKTLDLQKLENLVATLRDGNVDKATDAFNSKTPIYETAMSKLTGDDHDSGSPSTPARSVDDGKLSAQQKIDRSVYVDKALFSLPSNTPELAKDLVKKVLNDHVTERMTKVPPRPLAESDAYTNRILAFAKENLKTEEDAKIVANALMGNREPAEGQRLLDQLDGYFKVQDPERRKRVKGGVAALYSVRNALLKKFNNGDTEADQASVKARLGEWVALGDTFREWLYKTDANGNRVLDQEHLDLWNGDISKIKEKNIRDMLMAARQRGVYDQAALCNTVAGCNGDVSCPKPGKP